LKTLPVHLYEAIEFHLRFMGIFMYLTHLKSLNTWVFGFDWVLENQLLLRYQCYSHYWCSFRLLFTKVNFLLPLQLTLSYRMGSHFLVWHRGPQLGTSESYFLIWSFKSLQTYHLTNLYLKDSNAQLSIEYPYLIYRDQY
jgi:hypothetical protein